MIEHQISEGIGTASGRTSRRPPRPDDWSAADIEILRDCWAAGWEISAIQDALGGVGYNRVTLKAFRLGLPARKKKRHVSRTNPDEDLLDIDPEHPGYKYLDLDFTDDDVVAAFKEEPASPLIQGECRNCKTPTLFESKFQRWCQACREELNQINSDTTSEDFAFLRGQYLD